MIARVPLNNTLHPTSRPPTYAPGKYEDEVHG